MKLINPSVEIIQQKPGIQGILENTELAGRTCYKSECNIKYDEEDNSLTAKDFVDRIVNVKKHCSIAEHGTVYLKAEVKEYSSDRYGNYSLKNPLSHYSRNRYSEYTLIRKGYSGTAYATTNYRVLLENGWLDDLQYLCERTKYHERRVTVRVKCSISVSREWNRHRSLSISEQSTRYCNYSKDKFNNEITFCIPYWIKEIKEGEYKVNHKFPPMWELDYAEEATWFRNLQNCENDYIYLVKDKFCKPQEAREVLPLSTATEVVYTGFVSDWKAFFELRTAENAHPDIAKLAKKLQEQFKQQGLI